MYAKVVVDTGSTDSFDWLTYEIPESLTDDVQAGVSVLVPLRNRQAVGYVISVEDTSDVEKTKPLKSIIKDSVKLDTSILALAKWISRQYMCPLSKTVLAMVPGGMQSRIKNGELVSALAKPRIIRGYKVVENLCLPSGYKLTEKQFLALSVLEKAGKELSVVELSKIHALSSAVLTSLEKKGFIEKCDIKLRRAPSYSEIADRDVSLTEDQQNAVESICNAVDFGDYKGFLLWGVTASGKTEVYIRCIEHTLKKNLASLILLPEIALTTQVMNIFKSRFGDEAAVLHSGLSDGERYDEWIRIQNGESRVVLGARSAVFAPLSNIGLIIVDEEHEPSYKQDVSPRYHGRDVAKQRAENSEAVFVIGSATPCLESFYKAQNGEYSLLKMMKRVENRSLPKVHVADLKDDYAEGRLSIFSKKLHELIKGRLVKGEQIMLLQNRRAHSTFLLCRDCGFVPKCPSCAVSLKFHSVNKKMICHHCDHTKPAPSECPNCGGRKIKQFGIGTQKVESQAILEFTDSKVLRLDRDTASVKGAHNRILTAFRQGKADILIGTQMIAKGLDFPNVTLVGIISSDTSLHIPDFRANERTFQLISQVSGRAGRGAEPGEVVVQTFDPENYAIECAVNHDYMKFYETEIIEREVHNYPPFGYLISILTQDADVNVAKARLESLLKIIGSQPLSERKDIEVIGPNKGNIEKLRGLYRWSVLLRSKDRNKMHTLLRKCLSQDAKLRRNLIIDVDPMTMV